MTNNDDRLNNLLARLDALSKRQAGFFKEIQELQQEIVQLKASETISPQTEIKPTSPAPTPTQPIKQVASPQKITEQTPSQPVPSPRPTVVKKPTKPSNLEKFIGENLINKIGIIITIIGVAIGAKYSIENDLISPLTRIILGYAAGFGLLAIGLKLKKKYLNYSSVLVSGAMTILYFITFFAYEFYELIPQLLTFGLMFVFTAFTVIAALNYNKQIIALIGLVGAYAVPFLLSNDSGNVVVLFSYVSIINIGILIIAFKKYWKPLYYVSFFVTWVIYMSWFFFDYERDTHFTIALLFLTGFFVIFYSTFLAYKLKRLEGLSVLDVILILVNSFIYFGLGYAILNEHETGEQLLGLFTLGNAIVHFIVGVLIFKRKLANKNLLYLIIGMVLVFITMAIPVQLDGNWVTLLWVAEAAILFWVGRTKQVSVYESISYILMLLALFSIVHDWTSAYESYQYVYSERELAPVLNIHFLTSVLFVGAFAFIAFLNIRTKDSSPLGKNNWLKLIFSIVIPGILLLTLYLAIRFEIQVYFNQLYGSSTIELGDTSQYPREIRDGDINDFKSVWILNYSLLFLALVALFNLQKIKNKVLGYVILGLSIIGILVFLTQGLYTLSELRESYTTIEPSAYFSAGIWNLGIRYVSLAFLALILFSLHRFVRMKIGHKLVKRLFNLLLHITIVWVLSSELLHWMGIGGVGEDYKLGLSILWGVYSLILIAFGIWKNKQYLRIAAIVLFGITLIKLFFYDISHLNTLSKTIVFVSLGVLLLTISFLYNKFKNKIADETDN